MPRKPVGTQTRPTADWFAGQTATAGGLARGSPNSGVQISLYNDAPAGQYLWVWEVYVWNDAEFAYRMDEFEGDQGTLLQQGVYIMAGRGAAFGHSSFIDATNLGFPLGPPSPSSFPSAAYFGEESGTDICYRGPGPRKVLPPGFSLAVINEWGAGVGQGALLAVTFYYTILPYIPS